MVIKFWRKVLGFSLMDSHKPGLEIIAEHSKWKLLFNTAVPSLFRQLI